MPDDKPRPVVYITEERSLDFGPATVYGELHLMTLPRPMPYASSNVGALNDRLIHAIRKELASYIPDMDYICPVGSPVVMIATGLVLSEYGGVHKFLGWDAHSRRYLEYRVHL